MKGVFNWHRRIQVDILNTIKDEDVIAFPRGLSGEESACSAGDTGDAGSIPESERSPGEGNGHPLQCSCLGNPVDRGAWRPTVQRVTESDMTEQLKAHLKIRCEAGGAREPGFLQSRLSQPHSEVPGWHILWSTCWLLVKEGCSWERGRLDILCWDLGAQTPGGGVTPPLHGVGLLGRGCLPAGQAFIRASSGLTL